MRQKPEAVSTAAVIVINIAVFFFLSLVGDTEAAAFMVHHGAMYEAKVTQGPEF